MKKRLFALLLASLLLLSSLAGCGLQQNSREDEPDLIVVDATDQEQSGQTQEGGSSGASYTSLPDPEEGGSYSALPELEEGGSYTSAEDVSLYLVTYNHLPDNFITKEEARALGWTGGALDPYAPGMCIGGDRYYNSGKLLPVAAGRIYSECDINTLHARSRGAERLVWSNDGLIYYTGDHYETFTLLYGTE